MNRTRTPIELLVLPTNAGGLTPQECAERCREAIKNWTQSMLEGRSFPGTPVSWSYQGKPWLCHEDAIVAWKDALIHWEKLSV